jgi:hypothetical protein
MMIVIDEKCNQESGKESQVCTREDKRSMYKRRKAEGVQEEREPSMISLQRS